MYVKTGMYTGNGGSRSITGVGFKPDFLIIANNSGARAAWTNSSITAGNAQNWDSSFGTGIITSLDSDGFTIPSGNNTNGQNYIYLALQKNSSNDLSVGTFSTTGSASSVTTSPSFQPDFVLGDTETSANVYNVFTTSSYPAGKSQHADAADSLTQGITSLDSGGFHYGTDTYINTASSTSDYVTAINATGIFKVGSYTGNGTSQNVTGLGFQPDFVIVKDAGSTGHIVAWSSSDVTHGYDFINASSVTDAITGSVSDGFSVSSNIRANNNGDTYFYIAWKNNAPATTTSTSSTSSSSSSSTSSTSSSTSSTSSSSSTSTSSTSSSSTSHTTSSSSSSSTSSTSSSTSSTSTSSTSTSMTVALPFDIRI